VTRRVPSKEVASVNKKPVAGIGRREFIQVSSAVAAGAVLLGPELLASDLGAAPTRLAVGYVGYVQETSRLGTFRVDPASSIFGTDGRFLTRDPQISVVSSGIASPDPRTRRLVELNADFAYFEGSERRTAPFHAWTYDRTTGDAGNPISFRVPLNDQQQVRLSVGTEISSATASPSARRRSVGPVPAPPKHLLPFTLSLQNEPDTYRLVRGYFILVPLAAGQDEPAWSSYQFWYGNGCWSLREAGDLRPASLEHLVVRVSFAE
jgi:hypothetical protein